MVGQPEREHPALNQPALSDEQAPSKNFQSRVMRPGEWEPTPDPLPKPPEDKLDDKKGAHHEKSLAEKRGRDWGLRDAGRGSVGVTRPIRIECYADRLVVVSDHGPAANKTINFGPRSESAVNALVSAVWERIESWGIAGHGDVSGARSCRFKSLLVPRIDSLNYRRSWKGAD